MIIVIDIGSSSVRSMVIDENGTIRKKCQKTYEVQTINEKTVVQDASLVLRQTLATLEEAGSWVLKTQNTIAGISVTAQRSSVIPVDADGRALDVAITWQDTRAYPICCEYKEEWEEIYEITGMRLTPVFSAPKMIFLKRNSPEIYQRAFKLIGFQEYILYHLTGQFATDTSFASRTSLFDIKELQWSERLLDLFGVDKDKLCPIVSVGSIIGSTNQSITKMLSVDKPVPVISAGGDQQCAALGQGCLAAGDIEVNSGSGAYVIGISDCPVFDPQLSVNCNVSAIEGKWIVEGAVLSAGKAVDWMNRQFFLEPGEEGYDKFMQACKMTPPGANGVLISPSFAGKGTPEWNSKIRAGIFQLSFDNKKTDLTRALLEGIAAELAECVDTVEALIKTETGKLNAAGGLMHNDVYAQILADMFGKTVSCPEISEATGIGAWISAEKALGNVKDYSEAYNKVGGRIENKLFYPNEKIHRSYMQGNKIRKAYEKIYE